MREGARDQTFRQAAIELAIGLLIGLGLGTLVARSIASLLFDVRPSDPLVFAAIVGALIAAGVGACIIPARRAVGVDPLVALHYE